MANDIESFNRWYVNPLRRLEATNNGDGGFVALAISCFLFERYATAKVKSIGSKADKKVKVAILSDEFRINKTIAKYFWEIIRDGMLHQGMPKVTSDSVHWAFFEPIPAIGMQYKNGKPFLLQVHPWKFMNCVLDLCVKNINLLVSSNSFPWAKIVPVNKNEFKNGY